MYLHIICKPTLLTWFEDNIYYFVFDIARILDIETSKGTQRPQLVTCL